MQLLVILLVIFNIIVFCVYKKKSKNMMKIRQSQQRIDYLDAQCRANDQVIYIQNNRIKEQIQQMNQQKEKTAKINDELNSMNIQLTTLTSKIQGQAAILKNIKNQLFARSEELNEKEDKIAALKAAELREQELRDKQNFYKITLEDKDKRDIEIINSIRYELDNPRPINMLIWTTYYSKPANEMCARVLGGNGKVTGIYKITNSKDNRCYIGQAVDVRERWREHLKCGLGIDTPADNRLYKAMLNDGIQNFSFELLESCDKNELNERESYYIQTFNSVYLGYNQNKGIGKNL